MLLIQPKLLEKLCLRNLHLLPPNIKKGLGEEVEGVGRVVDNDHGRKTEESGGESGKGWEEFG